MDAAMTPLRWTRTPPTEVGVYWCRVVGRDRREPFPVVIHVCIVRGDGMQSVGPVACVSVDVLPMLSYFDGGMREYYEWAGPIAPPEEPPA